MLFAASTKVFIVTERILTVGSLAWGHSSGCLFQSVLGRYEESLKFLRTELDSQPAANWCHLPLGTAGKGTWGDAEVQPLPAWISSSHREAPQAPSPNMV